MKKLLLALAMCLCISAQSNADSLFYTGSTGPSSPTFDAPGASGSGSGVQYYSAIQFTVDATGAYTFESASLNTAGTPTDAMDTFLVLYADSFDPNNPDTEIAFDDDFSGTFSVLPGPFAGDGVTSTSTGFTGAQPGSQMLNINLTAGTNYWLVNTSFRDTTYVSTTTSGQAFGSFYNGIDGPGAFTVIPEPGSLAILGLTGLGLVIRRRRA